MRNFYIKYAGVIWYVVFMSVFILISLSSCKSVQYVPIETTSYKYSVIHDTLVTHDTITHNTTTIIKELDSIAMSQYGITLANNQKAWMIDKSDVLKQISDTQKSHTDTLRDTTKINVPYPVEKQLNAWQQFKQDYFLTLLLILVPLVILIFFILYKYIRK